MYYPHIFLEGVRRTMDNIGKNSRRPDRDFNLVPPEYKSKALPLEPNRSASVSRIADSTDEWRDPAT
jgi:hypothetical protein